MTWVVAVPEVFGHAIVVSDVRVSFSDGSSVDCLQKLHEIGPFVIAGFAGSVELGFRAITALRTTLSQIPRGYAWALPDIVGTKVRVAARDTFTMAPPELQELGLALVVASAHPSENVRGADFARADVFTLRSPDFVPEPVPPRSCHAIGSGSGRDEYMTAVGIAVRDPGFLQAVMAGGCLQASSLAQAVEHVVSQSPDPGISRHVQIGLALRGRCLIYSHEYTRITWDGAATRHAVPHVAKSWAELCQILSARALGVIA